LVISGKWYGSGSAAQNSAALHLENRLFRLEVSGQSLITGSIDELTVSDRVGNVERTVVFSDESVFRTKDNDAVDAAFRGSHQLSGFVHALESRMIYVVVALVLTVSFSFSFFKWGVPWVSSKIAHSLPHQTNVLISSNTLEFLDEYLFEESKLDQERRDEIKQYFESQLVPLYEFENDINYTLHFRDWSHNDLSIPNALALPVTDKFVQLCQTQDELSSVLLHEMGHVVRRHTLESVIESTILTTVVLLVVGDTSGFADLGVGIGSFLVSSNYSRSHESEADKFAFDHMLKARIDPKVFSDILARMNEYMESSKKSDDGGDVDSEESADESSKVDQVLDYLASHPSTAERVKEARLYSQCYREGLIVCDPVIYINDAASETPID